MQAIQLYATPEPESFYPETVNTLEHQAALTTFPGLGDALAEVLKATRDSEHEGAMEALEVMLAYMESLEKKIAANTHARIVLSATSTLTV